MTVRQQQQLHTDSTAAIKGSGRFGLCSAWSGGDSYLLDLTVRCGFADAQHIVQLVVGHSSRMDGGLSLGIVGRRNDLGLGVIQMW